MSLSVKKTLEDGATVVVDDVDGFEAILKPGQWEEIAHLPASEQRTRAEQFVLANRTSGDPRTEVEQQAIETARNASSGEAHEQEDEAR